MLLILVACSEKKEISDERGSLLISSTVEDVEISRAHTGADVNQFTLMLENQSNPEVKITGLFSDFPNGTIADVPVGSYELILTSHPDGFTPAFEDPWYEGLKSNIPVTSGRTTMVTVECLQANTGITFIYDPSLEKVGLGDIVPEMTQDGTTLHFEGENWEAKAYFLPKQVELKIKHGDGYLKIGGKETQLLDLDKQQLWETTLKASEVTGKMSIVATVKVITEPTNFIEFGIGEDLVEIFPIEIKGYTSSFQAKGTDITDMKYGLFEMATVDHLLNSMTMEQLMTIYGDNLLSPYLAALNSEEGLLMNFNGMKPLIEYSLLAMPTQNNIKSVQRYDFVSADDIRPDPVQDPNGPITPGLYLLDIFEDGENGVHNVVYQNDITVTKAVQENMYIIGNLYLTGMEVVAEYKENTGLLTFTGKDLEGYNFFNESFFVLNDGEFDAGVFLTDENENQVDKLIFTVENRKLSKTAIFSGLRIFDPLRGDDLGWFEFSPMGNPFTYVSAEASVNWKKVIPLYKRRYKYSSASTRNSSTRANENTELRSSLKVLK